MIDLYFWTTPNGYKPLLFLEETGLSYTIVPVDISKGEQFAPQFLAVSPNNRIPAIVDRAPAHGGAPIALFESGAILLYLAEKTGAFLPAEPAARAEVMQWLFWQMGGLGPMLGQNLHFSAYAPVKIPYAIERYVNETERLYRVLDDRLADRAFVAEEDPDAAPVDPAAIGLRSDSRVENPRRRAARERDRKVSTVVHGFLRACRPVLGDGVGQRVGIGQNAIRDAGGGDGVVHEDGCPFGANGSSQHPVSLSARSSAFS